MALIAYSTADAQQVKPRIAGLEVNERYMHLLQEDHKLTNHEDSIALVVESLRESFRASDENSQSNRSRIISLENELFELRARKGMIVDSLNIIEQDWVINNIDTSQSAEGASHVSLVSGVDLDVKYIYESPNVESNLSRVDYRNLVKAEELEALAEQLSSNYIINYDNMLSLSSSYQTVSNQRDADKILTKFDSLSRANVEILERLDDSWAYIYDNKSFAYSLLMELLGFTDVLQQEAELMRKAQAEISTKLGGGGVADELLRYYIQKSSMVDFEVLVAEKLELNSLAQQLSALSKKLASIEKVSPEAITIEERSFINFEPIQFVTKPFYTTSNPIPKRVEYERGVIFRIFVGSFQTVPPISTFRNTIPIAHSIDENKRHCYYIGGFETFEEAEDARAALKRHGFRAPQVVVWSDGKERNLTRQPLPLSTNYRVEILETPILPTGAAELISEIAADSPVSKVGNDRFVITSLTRQRQVDSLVSGLQALDPTIKISVEKSEVKIEL